MADNFLFKTSIGSDDLARIDGVAVIDSHDALMAIIEPRLGVDAARLFAVPLVGRDRSGPSISVSWYSDRVGTSCKLSALEGAIRHDVAARLAESIEAIRQLATTPDERALLDAALSVASPDDVIVVGAQPVLTNWGVTATASTTASAAAQDGPASNFAATVAPLLPMATAPVQAAVTPDASPGPLPSTSYEPVHEPTARPGRAGLWVPLALCVLLAALIFWLLLPGTRIFPEAPAQVARDVSDSALDVARNLNADLEARAAALQTALDGGICTAEGNFVLPDGRTPEGLLPSGPDQTLNDARRQGLATPLMPSSPTRLAPPPNSTAETLLEVIEAQTVLILSSAGDEMGIGTGFFIAPDVVATNHHVVADSLNGGDIFVINTALAGPHRAQIIQTDGPFEVTGGDFALLRIEGASQPYFSLLDGAAAVKGQAVMAAGFPFDITGDDIRFRRLMENGGTEVPDLVVTSGIVNSEQEIAEDVTVLVHSASISKGNSGGPLVDQCGRVVGMNTFISEQSYRMLNVAQSAKNLQNFLSSAPVRASIDTAACAPMIGIADQSAAEAAPK